MRNPPIERLLLILAVVLWAGCADRITTAPAIANARTDSTPSIEDIWKKIDANYSQVRDLQYNVTFIDTKYGIAVSTNSAVVQMKGPYKVRVTLADGTVQIKNRDHSIDALSPEGCLDGSMDCAFFWDVLTFRKEIEATLSSPIDGTVIDCRFAPKKIMAAWLLDYCRVDYAKGFVTELGGQRPFFDGEMITLKFEFSNPKKILPGCWLPTRFRVFFGSKTETASLECNLSSLVVNQGLADSLFIRPTK